MRVPQDGPHDQHRSPSPEHASIAALRLLIPRIYPGSLAPDHLADLRKSGLTSETIRAHLIRSVPPAMIPQLLGFNIDAVRSAYIIPFPDPMTGRFMDHVRMKIFPPLTSKDGQTVKYLQPRRSGVRLYFPLPTLPALDGNAPLWVIEGEKKSLAVAQLRLPAIGFCGIEGWHAAGFRELIPDFGFVQLRGRVVELVPDGDWRSNPNVWSGAERFSEALEARGARPRLVVLPEEEMTT